MIKAASFSEAYKNRYLLPPYPAVYLDTYITNLIADFRDASLAEHRDGGQALFAEYGEGLAATHAHPVAQWQLYVTGSARLAKKPVQPVTIQYTDEWVPYGPIEVGKEGFALLALWPRPNDETYEMPKDANTIREHLRGKPHRIIFKQLEVPDEAPTTLCESTLIEEGEVWARCWRLPKSTTLTTPDPSHGGGQFFVPLRGSFTYDGYEYERWSTVYIGPRDRSLVLRAGGHGAEVIGMQFAR
ncbi:MAG: hypothetical protein AB7G75_15725 [Candidatus Binatia bacterium]